ncbi:phage tail tape measure protein [Moraxella sp. Pampa]|uniref:phage tail tape measure protein n=1 Tax=Moraxella sp. Pampa TaxID=3111978 RepID=UPI002B417EB6|nr:phage tail tape measure protein [Moraxella sp. Pampa]
MSVLFLNVNFQGNDKLSSALEKMGSAAKKLQSNISDTQKKLAKLEKFQLKNDQFIKFKAEFEKNSQALDNNRKKVAALQQQLAKGGGKRLAQELKKAESETKKLQNAVSKGKDRLFAYRQELNQAGFGGKSFADVQSKIRTNIDKTNASLQEQQAKLEKLQKAQDRWDLAKKRATNALMVATGAYQLGKQTAGAINVPIKLAIDGEKSMADVAKVVDGLKIDGKVTQEYHQFEAQMTQMSNQLGKSFADVAAIVANGAQGGIAKNELIRFAKSTAKISVAWDMAASDVGQSIAELRSTLKLSQNEVEHLADQINYLGNNSTNNAAHILEVVQRVSSVGAAAGVSGELVAAMGASLSGIDPSNASTGLKNIIKSLTKGTSATKSAQKAWKTLGTTAEQMAVDMLKDPQAAISKYIHLLTKLPEEQRLAFAATISGDEALPVLTQMMNNPTKFQSYAFDLKDKNKVGGSADDEYTAATSTTAAKIERAKVKLQNLGKDFGKHLLPVVGKIADGFSAIIDKVSAWIQANPQIAKYLAMAAVGVMGVLAAITAVAGAVALLVMPFAGLNLMIAKASVDALRLGGAFKTLLGPVIGGLKSISSLFGMVRKGFVLASWGVRAFSMALLTNPLTWVVAAIAGGAFLIYKYWKPIKAFFAGVWEGIKEGFAPLQPIFDGIGAAFDKLSSLIMPVFDHLADFFNLTQAGEGNARSMGQAVGKFLAKAFLLLTAPIDNAWHLLKGIWQNITDLFDGQVSIGDIFSGLGAKFDTVVATITQYKDKVAKLWNDFWSVFQSKQSHQGVAGFGEGFWSSLVSGFESAKTTISKKAGSLWESAKAEFESAKVVLSAKVGEICSNVGNAWHGLVAVFGNNAILSAIMSVFRAVLGYLSGLGATMRSIGANIMGGLIGGISSGFESLKNLWKTVNSYIPSFSKKSMAIHSPSRVMRSIGGHIMDGMTVGIARRFEPLKKTYGGVMDYLSQPAVVGQVAKMTNINTMTKQTGLAGDLVRVLAPTMSKSPMVQHLLHSVPLLDVKDNTPKPATMTLAKSAPAMMATSATHSNIDHGTTHFSITINADKGMDERTLAMRVREEIQKHQAKLSARHRARLTD